jgi:hypothetical protein
LRLARSWKYAHVVFGFMGRGRLGAAAQLSKAGETSAMEGTIVSPCRDTLPKTFSH